MKRITVIFLVFLVFGLFYVFTAIPASAGDPLADRDAALVKVTALVNGKGEPGQLTSVQLDAIKGHIIALQGESVITAASLARIEKIKGIFKDAKVESVIIDDSRVRVSAVLSRVEAVFVNILAKSPS